MSALSATREAVDGQFLARRAPLPARAVSQDLDRGYHFCIGRYLCLEISSATSAATTA
jgi:hypothetical protein